MPYSAVAIAEFEPIEDAEGSVQHQISLEHGDVVQVVHNVRKGGWLWAVKETGEQGYIPAAFVRKMRRLAGFKHAVRIVLQERTSSDAEENVVNESHSSENHECIDEGLSICSDIVRDIVDESLKEIDQRDKLLTVLGAARAVVESNEKKVHDCSRIQPLVQSLGELVSRAASLLRVCDDVEEMERVGRIVDAHCKLSSSVDAEGTEFDLSPTTSGIRADASFLSSARHTPRHGESLSLTPTQKPQSRITSDEKRRLYVLQRQRRRREKGAWRSLLAFEEEAAVERRLRKMNRYASRAEMRRKQEYRQQQLQRLRRRRSGPDVDVSVEPSGGDARFESGVTPKTFANINRRQCSATTRPHCKPKVIPSWRKPLGDRRRSPSFRDTRVPSSVDAL